MYARSVNRTLALNSSDPEIIHDGKLIVANSRGTFRGYTGEVTISVNGTRAPIFYLFGLDAISGQQKVFMVIESENNETSVSPLDVKRGHHNKSFRFRTLFFNTRMKVTQFGKITVANDRYLAPSAATPAPTVPHHLSNKTSDT